MTQSWTATMTIRHTHIINWSDFIMIMFIPFDYCFRFIDITIGCVEVDLYVLLFAWGRFLQYLLMMLAIEQYLVLENNVPLFTEFRNLLQTYVSISQSYLHFYRIYRMFKRLIPEIGMGAVRANIDVTYLTSMFFTYNSSSCWLTFVSPDS